MRDTCGVLIAGPGVAGGDRRATGETQVRVLTMRETCIRVSGVVCGGPKNHFFASDWEHRSTGEALVLLRHVRWAASPVRALGTLALLAWEADGCFDAGQASLAVGAVCSCSRVAAQLPRRLSASCDLVPGSAV